VLESTSPGITDSHERLARRTSDSKLADDIERDGIEAFVKRWESLSLWDTQASLPEAAREQLRKQRLANNVRGLANSLRGAGAGEDPPITESAEAIEAPTLLIAGALDEKYSDLARLLARTIPAAHAEIIENAGHTVHLEQPAAFLNAITGFLAQIPSDGSHWR
jgi:2-succinyl-6-hydroxy-2,4-cyclohexadiene-1-carboxylate synthase